MDDFSHLIASVTEPVLPYDTLNTIRAPLEWKPSTSFAEGLQRIIDWYTRNRDREQVAARLGILLMER